MNTLRRFKRRAHKTASLPLLFNPPILSAVIGKPTTVLGKSLVAPPGMGHTQTFITIGAFDTREEAVNCNKYINTKFCKVLLSIKKCTQHNSPAVWEYVPLQDFTANSDIDWSKSLPEIDRQLYRKYKLDWREIAFIEANIKYRDDWELSDTDT